jgi:hypothetical protein
LWDGFTPRPGREDQSWPFGRCWSISGLGRLHANWPGHLHPRSSRPARVLGYRSPVVTGSLSQSREGLSPLAVRRPGPHYLSIVERLSGAHVCTGPRSGCLLVSYTGSVTWAGRARSGQVRIVERRAGYGYTTIGPRYLNRPDGLRGSWWVLCSLQRLRSRRQHESRHLHVSM